MPVIRVISGNIYSNVFPPISGFSCRFSFQNKSESIIFGIILGQSQFEMVKSHQISNKFSYNIFFLVKSISIPFGSPKIAMFGSPMPGSHQSADEDDAQRGRPTTAPGTRPMDWRNPRSQEWVGGIPWCEILWQTFQVGVGFFLLARSIEIRWFMWGRSGKNCRVFFGLSKWW